MIWQLQGNADLLDLYLKRYLASNSYNRLHHLTLRTWQLCSEITTYFASLQKSSIQPIKDILKLIIRIKHFFISIKIYCYRVHRIT